MTRSMWIRPSALLSFLLLPTLIFPLVARADQNVILNITLNRESKGDFFVVMTNERDVLIRIDDLRQMGFRDPKGQIRRIEGEVYIALSSMRGVGFKIDERTLSLEITALPSHLSRSVIDFMPQRPPKVDYTNDSGGFLNYRLDYSRLNDLDSDRYDLTNQLGIYHNHVLFLTDTLYTRADQDEQFIRLLSNLTYDRRDERDRIVLGDFFAQTGELQSGLTLGGLSYAKTYRIDPYFIKHPQIDFSGSLSLPTEMTVYLDGAPIRRERLSPGEFELRNISTHAGIGLIEVVLKDPFGREERIQYPFYLADTLLKEGLHEYSYNLGFIRESFGEESFDYGDPAFSAFHRYGATDSITVGLHSEASDKVGNLGSSGSFLANPLGVLSLALAGSYHEINGGGWAASAGHIFQGRELSLRILYRLFSEDYATIAAESAPLRPKSDAAAGIGYGTRDLGFFNLDYTRQQNFDAVARRILTASYSRTLTPRTTFFSTARRTVEEKSSVEIFLGIHYYPGKDQSLSARYQGGDGEKTVTVQAQKNPPIGEGYGGRLLLERSEDDSEVSRTVDTFGQANLKYGIYSAAYRQSGGDSVAQLSAAGGLAYIAGTVGVTRPITDSFGLVQVGELEGVRVSHNNQEIGRTNASGKIFVPNMNSYFDNQISIDDRDVPLDYTLKEVQKLISPPLRSGSLISFEANPIQAFSGRLLVEEDGRIAPAEFYEVLLQDHDPEILFPTGKDGEFYFENARPGLYEASFEYADRSCSFKIDIPTSESALVELGEFICEVAP